MILQPSPLNELSSLAPGSHQKTVSLRNRLVSLLLLLMMWNSPPALAQTNPVPLTVEVDIESSTNRSGGPIPLQMHITYFGSKVGLSGSLACRLVSQDGTLMGTYQFDGLFLPRGTQTFQFLIQPPTSGIWQEAYDLYPVFITDEGEEFHVLEQLLRLPGASRRSCVITIATDTEEILSQRDKQLASAFVLERYMPGLNDTRPAQRPIVTLSRAVDVKNFPTHALEHCVSDLVLLPGDTFSRLGKRQVQALMAWVRSGGSAAIFLAVDDRLTAERLEQLNNLLDAEADTPVVFQLSDGSPQFTKEPDQPFLLVRAGLGRVVLGTYSRSDNPLATLTEDHIRKMFIHLWKVRQEQVHPILHSPTGAWSLEPSRRYTVQNNSNFYDMNDPGISQFLRRFRPTVTGGGTGLIEETFPTGMQFLPLWMIGVTLFLYILMIGPVDYFLLSALKLRKYTWILFPLVTVLFTMGAIFAANLKMSGSNDGGHVVIRDITEQGLIARENILTTIVPRSTGEMTRNAKRELLMPIEPQQLGVSARYGAPQRASFADRPPVYRGRFPTDAQLTQRVHKWSVEMMRQLRIPHDPTPEPSGFDWTQPITPEDRNTHLALTRRIQATFGNEVHAQLIRRNGQDDSRYANRDQLAESLDRIVLSGQVDIFDDPYGQSHVQTTRVVNGRTYTDTHFEVPNFLRSSAFREEAGIYSVVSRLSPKCDDFLEDLPVLDSSNPDEWLLIIVTRDGNHWNVYRRLIESSPETR